MKKLFLSLLVALLPLVASAENVKIGDLWYEVISKIGEATVIKSQDNSKYSGKVVIPESVIYNDKTYSVTSISSTAFSFCEKLTSIIVDSENKVYDSRNNCNAIIETASNNLIAGCKTTVIPNSVTSIGDNAFYYCSGLTSVTIGNSVTSIGSKAFANCAEITNVYSLAEKVPSTNSNAFENSYIEYITLHVPASFIEKYKTTTPWSSFGKVVTLESGDVQEPETCAVPTITYQNGKLVFGCETEGAVCHSTITDSDIASYTTNEVTLTATYNISVYATKEGYKDSEVAKATLCWIDVEPKTEGVVETEISNVKALPVMVQVNGGMLTVSGANDGTKVEVFTIAGAKVGNAVTSANTATVNVSQLTDKVIIVKVGSKAIKMTLK